MGQKFLTIFAEEGQKIEAIGLEFTENGFMHDAKMDLNFIGKSDGEWGFNGRWDVNPKDENGRQEGIVYLNTDLNSKRNDAASEYRSAKILYKYNKISKAELDKAKAGYEADRAGTIIHELLIHGIYDMIGIKKGEDPIWNAYNQHVDARNEGSYFRNKGLPAIYQIHKILRTGKPESEIEKTTFNYQNR